MLRILVLSLALFPLTTAAFAAITVDIFQGKAVVTQVGGKAVERIEPVDSVVPGDTIVYRYTVRNDAAERAEKVAVTGTVPDFMTYIRDSGAADGWSMTVSNDNGEHAPEGELVIYEIDETSRPAEPGDIRYLRWILQGTMPAWSHLVVEFRATLDR